MRAGGAAERGRREPRDARRGRAGDAVQPGCRQLPRRSRNAPSWSGPVCSRVTAEAAIRGRTRRAAGSAAPALVNGPVLSGADLPQYDEWGWTGLVSARSRLRIPAERVAIEQLGPGRPRAARLGPRRRAGGAEPARRASRDHRRRVPSVPARRRRTSRSSPRPTSPGSTTDNGRATGVVTAGGDQRRRRPGRVRCRGDPYAQRCCCDRASSPTASVTSLTDHPSREHRARREAGCPQRSALAGHRRGGPSGSRRDRRAQPSRRAATGRGGAARRTAAHRAAGIGAPRSGASRRPDGAAGRRLRSARRPGRPCDGSTTASRSATRILPAPAFDDILDGFEVSDDFGGYAHATSTCRMGTVVDDRGAVRGYENLYVCDASVFPEIPASGTYLPTILLAERLAALWRDPEFALATAQPHGSASATSNRSALEGSADRRGGLDR